MPHTHLVDPVQSLDPAPSQPIDARRFLATCALCSLGGLAVLAGLAQTLVSLWGPVV
jgi:hypothetical protein